MHRSLACRWNSQCNYKLSIALLSLITRFMGLTWDPSGTDRSQVGSHVGLMNFAIWGVTHYHTRKIKWWFITRLVLMIYKCELIQNFWPHIPTPHTVLRAVSIFSYNGSCPMQRLAIQSHSFPGVAISGICEDQVFKLCIVVFWYTLKYFLHEIQMRVWKMSIRKHIWSFSSGDEIAVLTVFPVWAFHCALQCCVLIRFCYSAFLLFV